MKISSFSFWSWDETAQQEKDVESRLSFIQKQGKTLVLNADGATVMENVLIRVDAFFGCANYVTSIMAAHPLLLKHAEPSDPLLISITIRECTIQTITAVEGTNLEV